MRALVLVLFIAACDATPTSWLSDAHILVKGDGVTNMLCQNDICQHNENVDLIRWRDAIYLVHRTAMSQVLGDNSSLHIYRSTDEGRTFAQVFDQPALTGRDLRDPHFYIVGSQLYINAITRLPRSYPRDSMVDSISVAFRTSDGVSWETINPIGPVTWSFWRVQVHDGVYYSAAYEDGDQSVVLFSSTDGVTWTRGAPVYTVAMDTPLETELVFLPSGKMMALVRMDGTDQELLGNDGRLRTKVCRAAPPYDSFDCSEEITGQRLDGPLALWWKSRLFVIARKHLPGDDMRKRTALFELSGDFETGPLSVREWGELPSAGDTAYAGAVALHDGRILTAWYSSNIQLDQPWIIGMLDATDIWRATLDLTRLR
jgi:hypothetical protein